MLLVIPALWVAELIWNIILLMVAVLISIVVSIFNSDDKPKEEVK